MNISEQQGFSPELAEQQKQEGSNVPDPEKREFLKKLGASALGVMPITNRLAKLDELNKQGFENQAQSKPATIEKTSAEETEYSLSDFETEYHGATYGELYTDFTDYNQARSDMEQWDTKLEEWQEKEEVDKALLASIILIESKGINELESNANGDLGLFQINNLTFNNWQEKIKNQTGSTPNLDRTIPDHAALIASDLIKDSFPRCRMENGKINAAAVFAEYNGGYLAALWFRGQYGTFEQGKEAYITNLQQNNPQYTREVCEEKAKAIVDYVRATTSYYKALRFNTSDTPIETLSDKDTNKGKTSK